jgi:hypothetical protein
LGKVQKESTRRFSKKSRKKIKFLEFLFKKNIYYPKNGIVLLSLANNNKKYLDYIINMICIGLKKFFKLDK